MKYLIVTILASVFVFTAAQASTSAELISAGNNFWSQGKLAEAEAEFKKALAINPESSAANERLASLYLTQNKTSEAIEAYQEAITRDPENANLFIGIAIAYLHKQYYQMAESMVNHAMELNPELENAQKLQQYIDAKKQLMDQAHTQEAVESAADETNH